jgi:hypothetical protein
MARRTLTGTWKSIERLVSQYDKSGDEKKLEALEDLISKVNDSKIVEALTTLFIAPYHGVEDVELRFAGRLNGRFPEWRTQYDEGNKKILLNPFGVFNFQKECGESIDVLNTPEARKSFLHYRRKAYLAELSKLPPRLMLFLLILNEVAAIRDITRIEKRGGEFEIPEGKSYLQLLWAFKELEAFMRHNKGVDLRSEYGIQWLESDWFEGK